jgi:hypothetical protein
MFIIDAALGFALGGLTEFAQAPGVADELFRAFGGAAFGRGGVDIPLAAAATAGREAAIAERQTAASVAGSGAGATAAYVAAATTHTNDPQNSHDTGVLANLRAVVERLRADQGDSLPSLDTVAADIKAHGAQLSEGRPALVADALAVVERTLRGERVVALGATDGECLQRVWHRADDPRNSEMRSQIRQAVFDALADAWEPGYAGAPRHIVCVNGRTTRLLAALVLLDWDTRNWGVKTLEQFKNDAFAAASAAIAATVAMAARGSDAGLAAAAAAWTASSPEALAAAAASEEDSERLADQLRSAAGEAVDRLVHEQGLAETLPAPIVAGIRREAQAAVV